MNEPSSDLGFASDGTTLVEVVAGFEQQGYTAQMMPRPGAMIRCASCDSEHAATEFTLGALRRTEGASDPADMVAVAALVCPGCDTKGTAALKFGPEASAEEDEVLRAFDDGRDRSGIDGTSGGGGNR